MFYYTSSVSSPLVFFVNVFMWVLLLILFYIRVILFNTYMPLCLKGFFGTNLGQ